MRNIRWQKMALRAANGLLDGVTALLVLLAVVWSGYALWDNSRVYAAADNVQAGLLAFTSSIGFRQRVHSLTNGATRRPVKIRPSTIESNCPLTCTGSPSLMPTMLSPMPEGAGKSASIGLD